MYIVNSVLGDASGGRWQVVCDYSRLLLERGHRVAMLLGRQHPPDLARVPAGVAVEFVSSHGHYDLWAAWRQRRRFAAQPPDLAIAHCSRSVALLKRALAGRAPVLAVTHSNKVGRLVHADACLALTPAIAASFTAACPAKPCFVVPNMIPVDSGTLPPWTPHRPVRFGALGRFDPVKGFDVFIDALGLLQQRGIDFEAQLAGAGAGRRALEQRAEALGLSNRLVFPGWAEDVEHFLADIDILCVPARSDAFGLTPLQAARAGVPMVLSKAAGHCEMFEPDTQALFADVGDAGQTADQLLHLADTPGLPERLRQSAFDKLLHSYSTQAVTEVLLNIIENKMNNLNVYN
jgi:glycosyltransferase involved in cell wall biosynthesis